MAMPPFIHAYRTSEQSLCVNSYLVEGAESVVAVDAPMFVSDALAHRARLNALGKELAGVLITHPHPDHYNGLTELVSGLDVPILALADVDREIRASDDAKRAQWGPVFGEEWPSTSTFANQIVEAGETVELGGLWFTPIDLGRGESVSETVWVLENQRPPLAFVGDLVFESAHPYIGDGTTSDWLASLDRALDIIDPATLLYVGHGSPVAHSKALIQQQKAYLLALREVVQRIAGGAGRLDDDGKKELVEIMTAYTGGARMPYLLEWGSDALASELAATPLGAAS